MCLQKEKKKTMMMASNLPFSHGRPLAHMWSLASIIHTRKIHLRRAIASSRTASHFGRFHVGDRGLCSRFHARRIHTTLQNSIASCLTHSSLQAAISTSRTHAPVASPPPPPLPLSSPPPPLLDVFVPRKSASCDPAVVDATAACFGAHAQPTTAGVFCCSARFVHKTHWRDCVPPAKCPQVMPTQPGSAWHACMQTCWEVSSRRLA